ncbi:UbiA family prenyltransferase [Spirochaetia bacterium 38H-sp]|uniref:UbiA family prenyltransferase n=1 Tax=Rarispira pelagica TaxID=3141764 RepID=A0ABU9U9T6_9SPIR
MLTLYQFARIVEIRTKLVSVSSYLIGTLYAFAYAESFSLYRAILMFIATIAIDMGTTAFNSFFDYYRGIDSRDTNREEDKVLVHQSVAPGYALFTAIGLFALSIIPSVLLLIDVVISYGIAKAFLLLVAGILSMLVGYFYNGGKKPISRGPLGELFAGGFLGGVLIIICIFIQKGYIAYQDTLLALPSTVFIASILTVNNTCDIEGDKKAGRRTLSILIGRQKSEILIYLEAFLAFSLAYACTIKNILPPASPYTISLGLFYAVPQYVKMHKAGFSHKTKGISMMRILRIFTVFSAAIIIPLAFAVLKKLSE